jgi:hypothetical protein
VLISEGDPFSFQGSYFVLMHYYFLGKILDTSFYKIHLYESLFMYIARKLALDGTVVICWFHLVALYFMCHLFDDTVYINGFILSGVISVCWSCVQNSFSCTRLVFFLIYTSGSDKLSISWISCMDSFDLFVSLILFTFASFICLRHKLVLVWFFLLILAEWAISLLIADCYLYWLQSCI